MLLASALKKSLKSMNAYNEIFILNGKFLILLTKCTHLKWALPDSNSFCVPPHLSAHFLFVGTMSFTLLDLPEFQMADLTSYLSGKGRNTENEGGTVKKQ